MSFLDRRLTSLALSAFQALESNTQTRARVLTAACGTLATICMWLGHLNYPDIFFTLLQIDSKLFSLLVFAVVLAPPFVVAFSIGSIICRQADEPAKEESGPMSGYFYRERANLKWKIAIVAGIIAAVNFLFMMGTGHSR